jgi:hypothetical protein
MMLKSVKSLLADACNLQAAAGNGSMVPAAGQEYNLSSAHGNWTDLLGMRQSTLRIQEAHAVCIFQ